MEKIKVDEAVSLYETSLKNTYCFLSNKINELLTSLLSSNNIIVHSITSREKDTIKLKEKILREGKSYLNPLDDITDLAGVRIITYFPSDVDKIIPVIENEFIVDKINSIDKRKTIDPSAFGYASVHLVVQLSQKRINLPEYAIFKDLKCEIQVRTILQHAWAEIEHDIAYKSNEDIPYELRRKFASLSGLLEIADREFESLRKDEKRVRENIESSIKKDIINIPINLDSLRFYLRKYHKENNIWENRLSELVKFLKNNNIEFLNQFDEILTKEKIERAENEFKRISKKPCKSYGKCLVKYFLVLSYYLNIRREEVGHIADCPALYNKRFNYDIIEKKTLKNKVSLIKKQKNN